MYRTCVWVTFCAGTYYNDQNNAKKFNIYRYIDMNVNYFQVKLRDGSPLPTEDMFWSKYCYPEARLWSSYYVGRMQRFTNMLQPNNLNINLRDD